MFKEFDLIKSAFPEAVLAGGALRDPDNGRPVKDYDIYINIGPNTCEQLRELFPHSEIVDKCTEYEDCLSDLAGVYDIPSDDGTPINLIILDREITSKTVVEGFDFGLCQIAYDGTSMYKSEAYLYDQENHRFTMLPADSYPRFESYMNHYKRLKDKYNYPLVVPPDMSVYLRRYVDKRIYVKGK